MTSKWISFKNIQSNFTLIPLITFGVLNQTSPNLLGSCRNTCRWCLRNYMINGKELTSELMSKWITFKNTQANFTLISLKTFEVLHQTSSYLQGSCRDIKLGKNNDKNAQRSMNTHCRQWVCGYCDCLGISFFFRLTTSDVRIRRQKQPNSENRVFHISLNKGYIGKAIFSRSFSARYHILKKKKKKKIYWVYVAIVLVNTLLLLATCPVSLNCSVTHEQRGHLLSAVSMTARIFSALATWKQCCFSASH